MRLRILTAWYKLSQAPREEENTHPLAPQKILIHHIAYYDNQVIVNVGKEYLKKPYIRMNRLKLSKLSQFSDIQSRGELAYRLLCVS